MKVKNYIAAVIVVFLAFAKAETHAQSKSQVLLDKVYTKVKSYDNISIQFKYTLDNDKASTHDEMNGTAVMSGDKYNLLLAGENHIYDGKRIYRISDEDEEVTIKTQGPDEESTFTPSRILSFYKKGYTYAWDIEQNVRGRKIQFISLTPTDKRSDDKTLLLGIDVQTNHIYKLIRTQKDGVKITLQVNSFKVNEPLSTSVFTFTASDYEDYDINDLDN